MTVHGTSNQPISTVLFTRPVLSHELVKPAAAVPADIRIITAGIRLPVNVLAHPSLTLAELGELGELGPGGGCR